jgi:hypothetical protein
LIFNKRVNLKGDIQVYKIDHHIIEKSIMDGRNIQGTNCRMVTAG